MFLSKAQIKAISPVHVLRGSQLCILGCQRALQNPELYTLRYARLLLFAIIATVMLHFLLRVPMYLLNHSVSFATSYLTQRNQTDVVSSILAFVQDWVLSIPFLMLNYLRSSRPEMFDELFMCSLAWADHLYMIKHFQDDSQERREPYAKCLSRYHPIYTSSFAYNTIRRISISVLVYLGSYVPAVGPFVLPVLSFYTLNRAIGWLSAGVIFGVLGLVLPRHYFVIMLQTYLSTRFLTRQLLSPYFARVGQGFTKNEKAKWYREREGVLFGFSLPFYLLMRLPYVGVLAYGLASASAAFLITKLTHAPPKAAEDLVEYASGEVKWTVGRRNFIKEGVKKALEAQDPSK